MSRSDALRLLEELLDVGFTVETDGDALAVSPRSRITESLRKRIRAAKPTLVEILDPPPPDEPCPACGSVVVARKRFGRWWCWRCAPLPPEEIHEIHAGLGWHEAEAP